MYNKLLERQIKRYIKTNGSLPDGLDTLFETISKSYDHYEQDRVLIERAMELNSQELTSVNTKLRRDTLAQKKLLETLSAEMKQRAIIEEALIKAKDEALEASRVKSEFLANMSHEIRTPMNGVIGMANLLEYTSLDDEQSDYVLTIKSSSETLMAIINDILDFSKIEAGQVQLEINPFNLHKCIADTVELFAGQAAEKNLEFSYFIHESVPQIISGDQIRFKQILSNLISNALKFTDKGEVNCTVKASSIQQSQMKIQLSVRDTGIGIPLEARNRLFKTFSQVDGSITRKYGGTGLGLSISKQLVELMGGGISVSSIPGVGTTFNFHIIAKAEESPEPKSPEFLAGKHALILEKSGTTRFIVENALSRWGITSWPYANCHELTENNSAGNMVDVIVMSTPDANQNECDIAHKLKTLYPGAPIILLSPVGHSLTNNAEYFATRIFKPLRISRLLDALSIIFESKLVDS